MSYDVESNIQKIVDKIKLYGLGSLTEGERLYFGIYWMFLEVNNGGFHTFFFNDAGRFAFDALNGLEKIGASKTAEILRQAMNVFPEGIIPTDQDLRRTILTSLPDEVQWDRLGRLSLEFFEGTEDVGRLMYLYIEKHRQMFPAFALK